MKRWLAFVPLTVLLAALGGCQRAYPNDGAGTAPAQPSPGVPLALRASPAPARGPGAWHAVGRMAVAREEHTATLLPNGQVLIVGGNVLGGGAQPPAELYDPATETFHPTGRLALWRAAHTATLLANGLVLVAGGVPEFSGPASGSFATATAELYDPRTGAWSPTTPMHVPRAGHTATLLRDGRVLVAGGAHWDASAQQEPPDGQFAELYDPRRSAWTLTGAMLTPGRRGSAAVRLPDGQVLLVGGGEGAIRFS